MSLIKQLLEVRLISIASKEKGWADGYSMVNKTLKISPNEYDLPFVASGKLPGGKWALIDNKKVKATKNNPKQEKFEDKFEMWNDYILLATDANDKVQVVATLEKYSTLNKVKSFKVDHLVAKTGSSVPAHMMYAAAVKAGITLLTDEQSMGGLKVWKKLSKVKGVTVYGWDKSKKKPINLGPEFDDENETHGTWADSKDDNGELYGTHYELNATKKDKDLARDELDYRDHAHRNVLLVATKS